MNNLLIKNEALKQGEINNLRYDEKIGGGSLVLCSPWEGSLYTEVIDTGEPFNDLVASWNTETPEGTCAEIYGRCLVDGQWSRWMSWGIWSTLIKRNCPDMEDGLVFANAYRDGGDSSVNVKDGKTATAFQLKAVLRAEPGAREMPSIRLLHASWKNTLDSNWQSKCDLEEAKEPEKKQVLLDVPAISQKRRDPNYGGVICSATSLSMMMSYYGVDVLPEEVSFANYDYGFGGNGNWSFTCACGGAYGFESYAAYMDFASLRRELSGGHPVALSVKYSNRKDSDVPYLENSTVTTHGHLVVCIGYRFSEELGEYLYYVNDPAGGYDLSVGPREYRESQLALAWQRRMTYICRKPDLEGCGANPFRTCEARLEAAGARPGVYKLMCGDKFIALSRDFLSDKFASFGGHGTLYWYVEGDLSEVAEGLRRSEANHIFHYEGISVSAEGFITIEADMWNRLIGKGKTIKVGVVENSGCHYRAVLKAL